MARPTADQGAALVFAVPAVVCLVGLAMVLGAQVAPWAGWALGLIVCGGCAAWFVVRALDDAAQVRMRSTLAPDPPRRPDGPPAPERLNLGPPRPTL